MKRTLVPLTKPELDLICQCLAYCEAHPSHRDIEITDIKEKMLYFSLKDKCSEPVKVFSEKKSTKKKTSKFDFMDDGEPMKPSYPDNMVVSDISKEERRALLEEKAKTIFGAGWNAEGKEPITPTQNEKVGERTQRKYNKSKLRKPPFGLA